jgi:hypothetical protein
MPLGPEFQVNTVTTPGQQSSPAVASDADGDFVVAWQSNQDGSATGIFARLFGSTGAPLLGELQVNTYITSYQFDPTVARRPDGGFVVAWVSRQDGSPFGGIFARRFDSVGGAIGGEFQVNTYTTDTQAAPSAAMDGDGDFVVVWQSYTQDGANYGVFGQRFTSAGGALGVEFQVNTYTQSIEGLTAVAMAGGGSFVVAWESNSRDGGGYGVFARRFDAGGEALATEFQVNTYTELNDRAPAVSIETDGDFIVAWTRSHPGDGSGNAVFAQRFASSGAPQGSELQMNVHTPDHQESPSIAALRANDFVVVWQSRPYQDGNGHGVFGRRFHGVGGSELQINVFTQGRQDLPVVARSGDGEFVVVWRGGSHQDGYEYGIFARRFGALPPSLDVDGNGSLAALSDGLLVLRHRFGLTGTALTNSAVGGGCTRCDGAAIKAYLDGLGTTLDVDGNGSMAALSDGLLVVRFLFNLTGSALTSGVVGGGCTRCDAAAIEPYLQTLN